MYNLAQATPFSNVVSAYDWAPTLDRLIAETEANEYGLAIHGGVDARAQRRDSGSYYTPADVADHVWDQFRRLHKISDGDAFRALIARTHFVEPAAGSGIFVLTFLRQALAMGLRPIELAAVRFTVIDINFAALQFVSKTLRDLESELDVTLPGIGLVQRDFLDWAANIRFENVVFIGNPPFVGNPQGSRWRNLYADFLEAMLFYPAANKAISLILPISICFSRDYALLREMIVASGLGISASSYDNIPDSLFKSGKQESINSNRANSQRCTILHLGGSDASLREAASLRRWKVNERQKILNEVPEYQSFAHYRFDEQIPRPSSDWILEYLNNTEGAVPLRSLLSRHGKAYFAVAGVGRNFIGIREADGGSSGNVSIRTETEDDAWLLLQILGSPLFFEYWRTLGDGFHVTSSLIERFPISRALQESCRANVARAKSIWSCRSIHSKDKLNAGKIVRSFDFREPFADLQW